MLYTLTTKKLRSGASTNSSGPALPAMVRPSPLESIFLKRSLARSLRAASAGDSCNIGGLNNYPYYFGVPYHNYSIMGPKTLILIIKAPILHGLGLSAPEPKPLTRSPKPSKTLSPRKPENPQQRCSSLPERNSQISTSPKAENTTRIQRQGSQHSTQRCLV